MAGAALIALRIGNTRHAAPLVMVNADAAPAGQPEARASSHMAGRDADDRYPGQ